MGVPKIDITFKELTASAVQRSSRGTVALLLEDATAGGPAMQTLADAGDIAAGQWSTTSEEMIRMALASGASKVLAVRVINQEEGTADYEATLDTIGVMRWNWLAAPNASSDNVAAIVQWIQEARAAGKTYKAVVAGATAPDCEGVVNFIAAGLQSTWGAAEGSAKEYTAAQYTPRIAGVLAGLPLNQSAAGLALEDIVEADPSADPDGDIAAGKLILLFNGEGYEIARGVTSLTTADTVPALFKKIKHVEGADLIADDVADIFRTLYRGKRVNSYENKQALVGDLTGYLAGITGTVLSPDYAHSVAVDYEAQRAFLKSMGKPVETMSEMEILKANTGEEVFLQANVMLIDAMEDLTMEITLN